MISPEPEVLYYSEFREILLARWDEVEPDWRVNCQDHEIEVAVIEQWFWCLDHGIVVRKDERCDDGQGY